MAKEKMIAAEQPRTAKPGRLTSRRLSDRVSATTIERRLVLLTAIRR
jgi:hypothetical protein